MPPTSAESPIRPRRRLPAEERRNQLLDVATEILLESGAQALTMERLAARAGVSKGLGYAYFQDAEDVAVGLWDREADEVYRRVEAASASAPSLEHALRSAVVIYFDIVADRGALLAGLQAQFGRGRMEQSIQKRNRDFLGFWADRLQAAHAVERGPAETLAAMWVSAVEAAGRSWSAGLVSRRRAEEMCVALLLDGFQSVRSAIERSS